MAVGTATKEMAAKCIEKMDFMKDWDSFRNTLHQGIVAAKQFGAKDEEIHALGVQIGDFLNEKVCPSSPQEGLLKEMWDVSTPDERKALTKVLFKMFQ